MKITSIDIAGKGVGLRLHKPILEEFGIQSNFVHLPDGIADCEQNLALKKDMLIIGTPTYKHIKHLQYGIDRYQIVLCEKPVGNTLNGIEEIHDRFHDIERNIYVNYQLRFLDIAEQIRAALRDPDMDSITINYCSGARAANNMPEWYLNYKLGGGILFSVFPHIIDFLFFLGICICLEDIKFTDDISANVAPMNKINLQLRSVDGIPIYINIDTKFNYDEFTLRLHYFGSDRLFDFIIDKEVSLGISSIYQIGSLSSREKAPWRLGFRRLINALIEENDDLRKVARITDAIKVQQVITYVMGNFN